MIQLNLPQELMTRTEMARVRRRLVHHYWLLVHRVVLAPGLYLIGPQRSQLVDVGVASAAATEMLVHRLLLMNVHLSSLYLFVPLNMLLPAQTLPVHTPLPTTTQPMMMTIVSTIHCNRRRQCR